MTGIFVQFARARMTFLVVLELLSDETVQMSAVEVFHAPIVDFSPNLGLF